MSFQVDTAFSKQYHTTIELLLQQMDSRFSPAVRVESANGEESYFDQVGAVEAQETNERFGDSPQMDVPHARRRVTPRFFDVGDFVDKIDEVQMLIDPKSKYVQSFMMALNRKKDVVVMDSIFGTAFTGKTGATSTTFPSANEVAVNFGGANSDLTIRKWIEAKRLLESYENDPEAEAWYIATTSKQRSSLLNSIEVTSRDFSDAQALVSGKINTFLGMNVIRYESITKTGNNREIPVWAKSGLLLAVWKDNDHWVDRRRDKKGAWYAYASMYAGATRMQENKVIRILCDETA